MRKSSRDNTEKRREVVVISYFSDILRTAGSHCEGHSIERTPPTRGEQTSSVMIHRAGSIQDLDYDILCVLGTKLLKNTNRKP